MPATAYSHWEVLAASEMNCTDHIAGIRAANNEGRIAINQSVPDFASTAVAIVARIEHFSAKPGFELLKRREVYAPIQFMPLSSVQ